MVDFEAQAPGIDLHVFGKLRESAAGIGVQKVKSLEELTSTFKDFVEHFNLKEGKYPIIQRASQKSSTRTG